MKFNFSLFLFFLYGFIPEYSIPSNGRFGAGWTPNLSKASAGPRSMNSGILMLAMATVIHCFMKLLRRKLV